MVPTVRIIVIIYRLINNTCVLLNIRVNFNQKPKLERGRTSLQNFGIKPTWKRNERLIMKILLIQPKEIHVRTKQVVVSIPLGLCYLAQKKKKKGHKVEILDCLAERYTHREKRNGKYVYGLPDNEILERIKAFGPQLIGVSSRFSKQAEATDDLCRVIKQNLPNIPIVTGGMHATVNTESLLADGNVDFVLQGEADFTLTDLADSLENKTDYSQIHGLGYKTSEGQIIVKEKGTKNFIPDLDSIPFPARDLLKMDIYYKVGLTRGMDVTSKKNVNVIK